jgi:glucokinase
MEARYGGRVPQRPPSADSGCVVGVDLGGTKLLAGTVGPDLAVHHRALRQALGLDQGGLLDTCVAAVEEARDVAGEDVISAVGFGIPCTIDRRTGVAIYSTHLPIVDLPFAALMSERLGLPVAVDNDATCAVLAEARYGAGRGCSNVVLLTLGTGIGGGLYLDGRLFRGASGAGAEMGHMVIDADGPPCQGACPNRGCLEALASGSALVREAALRVGREPDTPLGRAMEEGVPLSGPLVTEFAHDGDPVARGAIAVIGRNLGVGLANLVNIFEPEVIVIGGGVIAAGEMLLGPAREEMRRRALAPGVDCVRVEAAAFGSEAGMIGAALLARDEAVPLSA